MLSPFNPKVYDDRRLIRCLLETADDVARPEIESVVPHLVVTLKSTSLAILAGPSGSGKTAIIDALAATLTGAEPLHYQRLVGHAWWASGNLSAYTSAQAQLTSAKLLALAEEAAQPENRSRLYWACLAHISPAEVIGLIADLARQRQSGRLTGLDGAPLLEAVDFPLNLWVTATFDTDRCGWAHDRRQRSVARVEWPAVSWTPKGSPQTAPTEAGDIARFLQGCTRDVHRACRRLSFLLGSWSTALAPLTQVATLLQHSSNHSADFLSDVLVYLSNAWSRDGQGLFDVDHQVNLALATDWALALWLPGHITNPLQRVLLREVLPPTRFPRAFATLTPRGTPVFRAARPGCDDPVVRQRRSGPRLGRAISPSRESHV
ncbi:MAG: hypothetical protein JNL73_13835 [Anaerolineales bacterium]|nr:hypothetical protein [Anaerolineales bacterium]